MAKEKEARRPFNLKKEVKLLPGYIILLLWVIFTIALLGWVFGASFSTTAEIFQGKALKFESGLHFENYAKAWNGAGVAGFFGNSTDLFCDFLHNSDFGVRTGSLCTVQI